jgi:predicted transcriptional regulator
MFKEKKRIDKVQAMGLILEHLISLESDNKLGQTIYGLRTKAFQNSQRDERIKNLVEILLDRGYVNSFMSGDNKVYYVITERGRSFYFQSFREIMELFGKD